MLRIQLFVFIIILSNGVLADEYSFKYDNQYYIDKYQYFDKLLYEPELHFSSPTLSLTFFVANECTPILNFFNNELYLPEINDQMIELYVKDYKSEINNLSGVIVGYNIRNEMVILDNGQLHYYRNNALKNLELFRRKEEYINSFLGNDGISIQKDMINNKAYNILNVLVDNPKDYKLKNSVWKKNMLPNSLPYLPCVILLFENDNAKKSITIQISLLDSSISEICMW